MRRLALAAAVTLIACAGSGANRIYAQSGQAAFAGGRWGEAMAAYDAAHDESPGDEEISARRAEAAAKWVEALAPELAASTPPEKAFALLSALAAEGNKRGAQAAVQQHVAPALEAELAKLWTGAEAGDDPKALWQAISRGENLTQSLPETAAPRIKLAALRQRAAAVFGKLANEAKHPSSAFLYAAMAGRMTDEKPSPAFFKAIDAVTLFDYRVSLATPANCATLAPELKKRMEFFKNFPARGTGLTADLDIKVDCAPLAPPRQRQELRSWVEKHVDSLTIPGGCVNRVRLETAGSIFTHVKDVPGGQVRSVISTPAVYKNVPDCDPPRTYTTERTEKKVDVVTITTEEIGVDALGSAALGVGDKSYVMPLSSRVVVEKVTTEGRLFGTREERSFPWNTFHELAAHGLWIELTVLAEQAATGFGNDLLARAAGQQGEARTGDMVSAVRVHQLVSKDSAKYFADTVGLEEHEIKELIIQTPRVQKSVKGSGAYKLEVPRVDSSVTRAAEEKKKAAGEDAFK